MLSSTQIKDIVSEARPIIERQLDDAERIAAFRDVISANGGDWSALKALIKAQIQDERDEAGDGKRVRKILDKADFSTGYADMLGWANMNEKNYSDDKGVEVGVDTPHDPETGEILESVQSHAALGPSAPAESASGEISATNQPETAELPQSEKSEGDGLRDRQHVHSRQTGEAKHGGQDGHAAAPDHAPHSNPQASSSRQADKAEAPSSSPDASAVNSEPTFAARPKSLTKPLCRFPGEDRCAGYGSVTCHACLRAAREDEVAA